MKISLKHIVYLLVTFMLYAFTGVFTKLASLQPFLSWSYIFYFGCVLAMLGSYAILWQKVLSFMPLNKAYLFKSVSILFVITYSVLLFEEQITVNNIIGTCFILSGLTVLAWKG